MTCVACLVPRGTCNAQGKSRKSTFEKLARLALFHIKIKIIKNILKKVLTRCNTVLLCAYSVALQYYWVLHTIILKGNIL